MEIKIGDLVRSKFLPSGTAVRKVTKVRKGDLEIQLDGKEWDQAEFYIVVAPADEE